MPHVAHALPLPVGVRLRVRVSGVGGARDELAAADALARRLVVAVALAHLGSIRGGRAGGALAPVVIAQVVAVGPHSSSVASLSLARRRAREGMNAGQPPREDYRRLELLGRLREPAARDLELAPPVVALRFEHRDGVPDDAQRRELARRLDSK